MRIFVLTYYAANGKTDAQLRTSPDPFPAIEVYESMEKAMRRFSLVWELDGQRWNGMNDVGRIDAWITPLSLDRDD